MRLTFRIVTYFNRPEIRSKHNAPELLDRYAPDMEVQINVAAYGGERVAHKRNTSIDPDDSLSEQWHNNEFRPAEITGGAFAVAASSPYPRLGFLINISRASIGSLA